MSCTIEDHDECINRVLYKHFMEQAGCTVPWFEESMRKICTSHSTAQEAFSVHWCVSMFYIQPFQLTYYPLSNISTSRNKRTSWQNLEFLSFVHHGINIHHGKIRCRTSWMYVVLIKYGINVHHGLFWITYVRTSWNKHRTSWKLMNSTASVHVLLFDSG